MGQRTKIDWCDSTWNPVTGCYHNCPYCYARSIAKRFGLHFTDWKYQNIHDIQEPWKRKVMPGNKPQIAPYPHDFEPTIHRYKLCEPQHWKQPRTIFVCSMADLFGEWVPDEWIEAVFEACKAAPQHRYLFLTKNPNRYNELAKKGLLPQEHWYGYTATSQRMLWTFHHADECLVKNLFVSIEPILAPMQPNFSTHTPADWVIVGAETGQRKNKVVPKREWIDAILMECEYSGRPIFMKESLRAIMGEDFRQEFPWHTGDGCNGDYCEL